MSYDFPGTVGSNAIVSSQYVTNVSKLTVVIWFNANVADGGGSGGKGGALYGHGDVGSETSLLSFSTGNKLMYRRNHTYGTTNRSTWETTEGIVPVTGWRCIVLTHDASLITNDPVIYLYRLGSAIIPYTIGNNLAKIATGTGGYGIADSNYYLGNVSLHLGDAPFNGKIMSITVWGRVLTIPEIRSVIFRGDKTVTADTRFGWDLRKPSTSPPYILDWTPRGNYGNPIGATYSTENAAKLPLSGPFVVV